MNRAVLVRALSQRSLFKSLHTTCVARKDKDTALLPGQFLVGAPDPISNIRPVKFFVPLDETPQELAYRQLRESATQKDHEFWLDNNQRFEHGRVEFERQVVEAKGQCTIDDLSEYYKRYQEESYRRHLEYNRYVWRRSCRMVWPGILAWIQEVRRRSRRRNQCLARHSEQQYFFDRQESGSVQDGKSKTEPNRRAEKIRSYY
ncbi:hypothetical protein EV183_001981 [Coemansia sp. RSA 2336]|nr:hypothetical protein EV183_001981 [Coemansia sp. RSA 2336]